MKTDAIIALINHPNPSPPDDVLRAAAFEALDMVTTAVDSLTRIADGRDIVEALSLMPRTDCYAAMRDVLVSRFGPGISAPDGTPESVAFDALGRLID